jgi:hypothetical protein
MLNSKPNNKNYHSGNYIPINIDKVIKLNVEGGVYYRSGLEKKMMVWLDSSNHIVKWGSECFSIPYTLNHYQSSGDIQTKTHKYYADFIYEVKKSNGEILTVVAEVKPHKEYLDVVKLMEMNLNPLSGKDNPSSKQLSNAEYTFKMAQKNLAKWKTMVEFCRKKGFEFITITEETFKKFNV